MSVNRVVTLLSKDPNKGYFVENFWSITLLNTEVKILSKILAKRLTRILGGLTEKTQIYTIPGRSIQGTSIVSVIP